MTDGRSARPFSLPPLSCHSEHGSPIDMDAALNNDMLIHTKFSMLSDADAESTAVWLNDHGILEKVEGVDYVAVQLRDVPQNFTAKETINVLRISSCGVLLAVGSVVLGDHQYAGRTVFCPMSNVVSIAAE